MQDFNVDVHSEKVIKTHLENTVLLWDGTFKGKTFYRVSEIHLTLPKSVLIKEAFFHDDYGWCVSFTDNEYPSVGKLFKPFSSFIQDYSCLKS